MRLSKMKKLILPFIDLERNNIVFRHRGNKLYFGPEAITSPTGKYISRKDLAPRAVAEAMAQASVATRRRCAKHAKQKQRPLPPLRLCVPSRSENLEESNYKRSGYQQPVKAVKESAVARERGAGILYLDAALEQGFHEVSVSTAHDNDRRHGEPLP
jgi:hypothetical protein